MKFLIDACLSPSLAQMARDTGCAEAVHVSWLGLADAKDHTLARRAVDQGYILVTNNRLDFLRLYEREEVHCGLIILNFVPGTASRETQQRLFALALRELGEDPYNEVLEITLDASSTVDTVRYALPKS